jgi:hypothetical protein
MNIGNNPIWLCIKTFTLALVVLVGTGKASASAEETFDVLQIGTHLYTNVTVTTKSKSYIFIIHAQGMTNVRVADLAPEVQLKLGYAPPEDTKQKAAAWAGKTVQKLETPQVKDLKEKVTQVWKEKSGAANLQLPVITTQLLLAAGGIVFGLYLFFCYCCMLICQKAGGEPGVLIFLPILQGIPLFRAAGMSAWWVLALFVPVLGFVAQILWCVKMAQVRQKGWLLALSLILPVTNVIAFLYLAFSGSKRIELTKPRAPRLMTLETA